MKTKIILFIVIIVTTFIVGGCQSKEDFVVEESWKTFMGGVNWGRSITTWNWYEWTIRWLVDNDQSGENILVSWNLWFGRNDYEQKWNFDGVIGNYILNTELIIQNHQHFIKVLSFENSWNQSSNILETLLTIASRYPHNFIHLRNFKYNSRFSLLLQPYQTFQSLSPFITFPNESCDVKSCPLIIDMDLLGVWNSWNLVSHYLQAAKKKDIKFETQENKINIESLELSGVSIAWVLTAHEIHLQTQSLGLVKRTMNIDYSYENPSILLDLKIQENQIPRRHWKALTNLEPNHWSVIVHQLLPTPGGSVRSERKRKSEYIPVSLGKTIDVYNLLSK